MAMHRSVFKRTILMFVIATLVTTSISKSQYQTHNQQQETQSSSQMTTRAIAKKPGFFRTLFSVVYEQWNDTRNTTSTINKLINDNFLPENAPKVETTTSSDPNATTTPAPYRITRSEFQRILLRNLRGLVRLYNIELKDSLQNSDRNYAQFKKNASAEVSKFL